MSVATTYRRPQPPMAYHSNSYGNAGPGTSYSAQNQSTTRMPYKSSATRTTHAAVHASGADRSHSSQVYTNAQGYKVESHHTKDGGKREIIVIEDTPDLEDTTQKRRKVNQGVPGAAYDNRYPEASTSRAANYAVVKANGSIDRKVAASGVGSKRKAPPEAPSSNARQKVAQQTQVQAPCDDKEGHFIVKHGEYLNDGRYRIEKLLGQGTFGKVVEAYDNVTEKWVAVKIIRSIQKYRDASKVEIKVLGLLRKHDKDNINKCIHLIDYFDDRNHICIVTELLSTSVFDFLKGNSYAPFPPSQIQHFAKQLLSSVAFLHDLHLIHTDLKPENILLVDNDATTIPSKSFKNRTVLTNSEIRLIDFGSATFEEEYHASVVSTRHYRAPEIILGLGWSFPCDVWSIGCILVEFYTGDALFQTHDNLEHLAMMEVVFGRIPERYARAAARNKPEWFKGTKLDFPQPDTPRQSRKYVKGMKSLPDIIPATTIINTRFLDLLQKLLTWDPNQRMTVKEALRHPYFALNIQDEGSSATTV